MSLTIFPPEILGLILDSAENSYLVIALWNAGDKILQSKVSKCMTVLEIRDSNPKSKSRFPKLISCLSNLCKLSIDRDIGRLADSAASLYACLLQLPPSITDLTVSSELAPSAFLNHAADESIIKSTYPRGTSELYDWSTIMPSLESLKIADYSCNTSIEFADFAGLPATLKRLHLPTFPRSQAYMMQSLPQSITDLDMDLNFAWTSANAQFCLPGLTRLSLISVPAVWIDALPRHLTSLDLFCATSTAELAALPSTQTELTGIRDLSVTELEENVILLPNLTRLHVPLTDWLAENINVISPKITSLKLHQGDEEANPFDPSWLPRNITELELDAICNNEPLSIDPGLPESLTSLKVTSDPNCSIGFDLSCLANLPTSITNLDLAIMNEYNSLEDIEDIKWPPRLQSLTLDVFRDDWFQQLPRCLTALTVKYDMEGEYHDPLLGLPPHLRHLKLCFSNALPCNKSERSSALECLAQLGDLETLSIVGLCFDPTIMASLSPRLRSLELEVDSSVSSRHFVDLPPRLRKMTLVTPNELEYAGTDYLDLTVSWFVLS